MVAGRKETRPGIRELSVARPIFTLSRRPHKEGGLRPPPHLDIPAENYYFGPRAVRTGTHVLNISQPIPTPHQPASNMPRANAAGMPPLFRNPNPSKNA